MTNIIKWFFSAPRYYQHVNMGGSHIDPMVDHKVYKGSSPFKIVFIVSLVMIPDILLIKHVFENIGFCKVSIGVSILFLALGLFLTWGFLCAKEEL